MFGREHVVVDDELGTFRLHRGSWRGEITLASNTTVPLAVPGRRSGPDQAALERSRRIALEFASASEAIDRAFTEEFPDSQRSGTPAPVFVQLETIDRRLMIEIGYRLRGDDDHTIGARIENGTLVELNGSIVPR